MTRISLFASFSFLLLCSCQYEHTERQTVTVPSSSMLTEQEVIEIAKQAITQNDTWADRATYKAKGDDDGDWSVTVWRITGYDSNGKPKFTPGGHRLVLIDSTGKVTGYMKGR